MAWRRGLRRQQVGRPGLRAWIVAGVMLLGAGAGAQEAPALILTLDQDRLFLESDFGKAVIVRDRADTSALEQENRRIEAELVAEEQALTEARAGLSAEEFSARAAAFDAKVERIREEQDAKARQLVAKRDSNRQEFIRVAVPVLDDLLLAKGALAILEQSAIIRSVPAMDVTDEAIAIINSALSQKPDAPDTP